MLQDQDGNTLTIQVFGRPAISFGGDPLAFVRRESAALLIYLAVTRRPHARDVLANLLWGNLPQVRAAANLHEVLSELRERVNEAMVITPQSVAVNPDHPVISDVATFSADVERGIETADPTPLARAVRTYRGDFLAGFSSPTADAFEEWALLYRAHLRERLTEALEALSTIYADRGDNHAALLTARRLVALEPWREEAHRRVMMLLARGGDRAGVVAQYMLCRRTLAEELGVELMEETTALYQRLVSGSSNVNRCE